MISLKRGCNNPATKKESKKTCQVFKDLTGLRGLLSDLPTSVGTDKHRGEPGLPESRDFAMLNV